METQKQRTPLYGFYDLFYSHVPFSFHDNWEQVTTHRAPYRWKVLIQLDASWCPEEIVNDTDAMHDISHCGFEGLEPCSPFKIHYLPLQHAKDLILEGHQYLSVMQLRSVLVKKKFSVTNFLIVT
jgi:hypothetical protein